MVLMVAVHLGAATDGVARAARAGVEVLVKAMMAVTMAAESVEAPADWPERRAAVTMGEGCLVESPAEAVKPAATLALVEAALVLVEAALASVGAPLALVGAALAMVIPVVIEAVAVAVATMAAAVEMLGVVTVALARAWPAQASPMEQSTQAAVPESALRPGRVAVAADPKRRSVRQASAVTAGRTAPRPPQAVAVAVCPMGYGAPQIPVVLASKVAAGQSLHFDQPDGTICRWTPKWQPQATTLWPCMQSGIRALYRRLAVSVWVAEVVLVQGAACHRPQRTVCACRRSHDVRTLASPSLHHQQPVIEAGSFYLWYLSIAADSWRAKHSQTP